MYSFVFIVVPLLASATTVHAQTIDERFHGIHATGDGHCDNKSVSAEFTMKSNRDANHLCTRLRSARLGDHLAKAVRSRALANDAITMIDEKKLRFKNCKLGEPGEMSIEDRGPYVSPVIITGKARTCWFHEQVTMAQLVTPTGSVLWEGFAVPRQLDMYDQVVPFETTQIDVGDFIGKATLFIYEANESDEPDPAPFSQEIEFIKR